MFSKADHLTPIDAAWLRMEQHGNPVDIASLLLLDGELPETRLESLIAERLLAHRRFRQRVVDTPLGIAPPRWEDEPELSVRDHLERVRLPAPGGTSELQALIGNVLSQPFDMTRSPWRVYLVDGLAEGSAILSRIHHCMGDGFALMQILLSMADEEDARGAPERGRLQASAATQERGSWRLANLAHLAGDDLKALGHLLMLPFDPENCLRGPLGGQRKVAWSEAIALSRVKEVGRARGATVNDVLMTALCGALRRYMAERGDLVDDLPLRAIVPVNLRPADKPVDLDHGNWFGLVFVDLPVHLADADERATKLKQTLDRIKASQEAVVSLGVLAAMGRAPAVVEHVLDDLFARKGSLVVTNVPGPRARLRIATRTVRDMMFWAPHSGGLALGVSILSYAGNLRVGVRSDADVVEDPATLARYFEQELKLLASASRGDDTAQLIAP